MTDLLHWLPLIDFFYLDIGDIAAYMNTLKKRGLHMWSVKCFLYINLSVEDNMFQYIRIIKSMQKRHIIVV